VAREPSPGRHNREIGTIGHPMRHLTGTGEPVADVGDLDEQDA
jgi:hypothetical protein